MAPPPPQMGRGRQASEHQCRHEACDAPRQGENTAGPKVTPARPAAAAQPGSTHGGDRAAQPRAGIARQEQSRCFGGREAQVISAPARGSAEGCSSAGRGLGGGGACGSFVVPDWLVHKREVILQRPGRRPPAARQGATAGSARPAWPPLPPARHTVVAPQGAPAPRLRST